MIFYLRSTISAMARTISLDVVTYLLDARYQNRLEDAGCVSYVCTGKGRREETKGSVFIILPLFNRPGWVP